MSLSAQAHRPRIVVAMSGGVDSSTAAALLCEQGAEVIGVTLKLYDASGTSASIGGRCCTPRDIDDARANRTSGPNFSRSLHRTHGFGVNPWAWAETKSSTTARENASLSSST